MTRRIAIFVGIVVAAAALPAVAAPGRYAISTGQIAAAVSSSGVPILPEQVTLFTSVVASVAHPDLEVQSIQREGQQGIVARIGCANSGQCLPFLVSLRVPGGEDTQIALNHPPPPVTTYRPARFAVRQGSHTALYLDGTHVHISLSVICLENGSPGQIIRATSLDRHQTFTAQVASDGTLRGRL
jgi:Chaperone for flagella basal body P-ring formation